MNLSSSKVVASLGGLLIICNTSPAQVIFSDSFDRADNDPLDATLDGITDNTGSALGVGDVYVEPFGAARSQILGNQLSLATGPGTSNARIDHNFINPSILTAGGFSISMDVTGMAQSSPGFGGAFAVGMSTARADSAGDALNASAKFQDGILAGGNSTSSQSIADFWVMLRGNGSLVWGGLGESVSSVGGVEDQTGLLGKVLDLSKTGTISADFLFSDFNAGATVSYEVFYNTVSQGTGTFTWSEANQNYIGLDARDSDGVTFDNLAIQIIPEPSTAALALLGAAGLFIRRRSA